MNQRWLSSALLYALVAPSSPARADDLVLPDTGKTSLSLGFPAGDNAYAAGTIGLWFMFTDRINFGANFGMGLNFDTPSAYDFLFAPALRLYLGEEQRIRPFLIGQVNGRVYENPDSGELDVNFGFIPGLGAELWILSELSVSGYLGLGFELYRGEGTSAAIGTLTSGIQANLYFDLF